MQRYFLRVLQRWIGGLALFWVAKSAGHPGCNWCFDAPNLCGFQTSLCFRECRHTDNWLATPFTRIWEELGELPIEGWMDVAHMGLREKSPTFMGRLRWKSCGKTFCALSSWFAIEAARWYKRAVDKPGVVCIRMSVVLLRGFDVIRRGTGLEIFSGFVLVLLPGSFTWRRQMSPFSSSSTLLSQVEEIRGDMRRSRLLGGWEGESWTHLGRLLFCWPLVQ